MWMTTAYVIILLVEMMTITTSENTTLSSTSTSTSNSTSTSTSSPESVDVECKDRSYLDNCLKKLPPILEKSEMKGIPSSKTDVDASCSAFKIGMGCMDTFANTCLSTTDKQTLDAHVAGARHTFKFLCDDPVFQSEYLQYTSCYKAISKDWDNCANRFVSLVREEVARKSYTMESRLLELCCARHGFLKCVYVAARLKCKKEEALFIKKIADTLSNMRVYSKHCRNVDVAFCGSADRPLLSALPLLLLWTLALVK
ncbi:uncharacterized protein LOC128989177 [Macrosteles quadrilineatus]|uniref:uncharacterized protein LOC128989177 n=1 Tax=Macrosteles quadrilineatus TaxID=74068 RepID=UPI0023E2B9A0|nr:uncharacterized protein LOC128989177 [Macrosteles quadrilineatus]